MEKLQYELDLIQCWLSETTEYYTDWDWDGETLTIFSKEKLIEKYLYGDLKSIIKNF